MTNSEKAELLKDTIYQLYSKEGRSKSYISRLLEIDRKILINKIKDWNLPEPEPKRYLKPSNQKFLNKNRNKIKSMLDKDISITQIAKDLGVTRDYIQKTIIPNDDILNKARNDYMNRVHKSSNEKKEKLKNKSSKNYISSLDGEIWKPILGFENYEVSNLGRVRKYIKTYDSYHEIKACPNKNSGRLYVSLEVKGKRKNLNLARIVCHAFNSGYSDVCNTVNHKDGDVQNNEAENLEWVSQGDNNKHSYDELNRSKKHNKKYKFKYILYKDKYQFKTIAAFARFLNKSETQTRRYLDNPEKYNIKLIK